MSKLEKDLAAIYERWLAIALEDDIPITEGVVKVTQRRTFFSVAADILYDMGYVKMDDLSHLGYVKVVRCGECRWWIPCGCPECRKRKSPIMACGNPDIIDIEPVRGEFDYCSAGEVKVVRE